MQFKKRFLMVFMALTLLAGMMGGGGAAYAQERVPDLAGLDITGTVEGENISQEAVARWQSGDGTAYTEVNVYKFGEGDYLVVPAGTQIRLEYVKTAEGENKINPLIVTMPQPDGFKSCSTALDSIPYWHQEAWFVYTRIENSTGWIDHRYYLNKLYDETDNTYDYFQLEHRATAKSKGIFRLISASLDCRKTEASSTMGWYDWTPGADLPNGVGNTITYGVTAFGITISNSIVHYDLWDITKYIEAGKFKNEWKGSANDSEREVGYMVGVTVPQGGWPQWYLGANFDCALG
ncbi:hypothetical protein Dehly_0489 [Dehalogenimonas lykanthroporepellens BL-DC-9]|nr:hypothetical protein Dehly_0489 [Dehalogenimonas lykanthroporepellens BL-DC-9]